MPRKKRINRSRKKKKEPKLKSREDVFQIGDLSPGTMVRFFDSECDEEDTVDWLLTPYKTKDGRILIIEVDDVFSYVFDFPESEAVIEMKAQKPWSK